MIPIVEVKFDTALTIFHLKRRLPETYGDSVGTADYGDPIELPEVKTVDDVHEAIKIVRKAFNEGRINGARSKVLCDLYTAQLEAIVAIEQGRRIEALEEERDIVPASM